MNRSPEWNHNIDVHLFHVELISNRSTVVYIREEKKERRLGMRLVEEEEEAPRKLASPVSSRAREGPLAVHSSGLAREKLPIRT